MNKIEAMRSKGQRLPLKPEYRVLYLGASFGSTASMIAGNLKTGIIYMVEFSPVPTLELAERFKDVENAIPIFADANLPESYSFLVEPVDLIYQDLAQPNQAEILLKNADVFLKDRGIGVLILKTRSIDVTKTNREVLESELEVFKRGFCSIKWKSLKPHYPDHYAIVGERDGTKTA